MWKLTQFGAVLSSHITDLSAIFSRQINIGTANVSSKLVQTAAGWVDRQGGRRPRTLPQTITLNGKIYASDLDGEIQDLTLDIGRRANLYREWADGSTQYCVARLLAADIHRTWPQTNHIPVTFTWETSGPWNGDEVNETEHNLDVSGAGPELTLTNSGNASQGNVLITITPLTTNATLISFNNNGTGCHLYFTGTVVAGNDLVINSETMEITNNGVDAFDDLVLTPHYRDRFMILDPGDNDIYISATGPTYLDVEVTYNEAWA